MRSETFLLKCIASITEDTIQAWKKLGLKFSICSVQDRIAGLTEDDLDRKETAVLSSKMRLYGHRRIGDDRSWVIPLETAFLTPSRFPDHLIDYANCGVGTKTNAGSLGQQASRLYAPGRYNIIKSVLQSPALRYEYINFKTDPWKTGYFRDRAILGMHLLPAVQQPTHLADIFDAHHRQHISHAGLKIVDEYQHPVNADWAYYDDAMVEFMKADDPAFAAYLGEDESRGSKRKREKAT